MEVQFNEKEYEAKCAEWKVVSAELLSCFEKDMEAEGLSKKTISRYCEHVNDFLSWYMPKNELFSLEQGIAETADYMGYFLIYKGLVTAGVLQEHATSMKRFYRCMAKHGKVTEEAAEEQCELIAESMPEWMEKAENF